MKAVTAFQPLEAGSYDISSGEVQRIHGGGVDVQWAGWNGNVYIDDPFDENSPPGTRVFRVDPRTEEVAPTPYQGVYFSPQGGHYYAQGHEGAPLRIFQTDTNEEIPANLTIQSTDRRYVANAARGWLDEQTIIVGSPDPEQDGDYLYDIESGALRYAPGAVLPTADANEGNLIVVDGTSIRRMAVNELQLVRY